MCLFVCPDSIKLCGVLKYFYYGDRILIKILIMVNKYADFEFRFYKFILFIFIVVAYKFVNSLVRIRGGARGGFNPNLMLPPCERKILIEVPPETLCPPPPKILAPPLVRIQNEPRDYIPIVLMV